MQRYDLTRMGPARFEEMTQALLLAELGPGLQVHGSGPDGGKDASFQGRLPIRTQDRDWSGFTVVQVKQKEELTERAKDARWLVNQLHGEVSKWNHRYKRPDQLLIITNVILTPAANGGEVLVDNFLKDAKSTIGLKGWDVWHADKICRLLEKHTQVRQTYFGLIVGDILQVIFDGLKSEHDQIQDAVCGHLASSFKAERFADIDQAGAADDLQVPLAQVFVDVPVSGLTADSMAISGLVKSFDHSARPSDHAAFQAIAQAVLIGGPGYGKTTIGRFLCQIYRAELLDRHQNLRALPEVNDEITRVRHICTEEKIPRPVNLRFPVFISLTRLADALAAGKVTSILGYIASRIGDHMNGTLVNKWLRQYPWLILFDGLDEVPASANRKSVLTAIDEFADLAVACNADIAFVATSRPQGYRNDFASYIKVELGGLRPEQALRYADRLIGIRHGIGSDRADEINLRLERAAGETDTARLMTNPLQVTILVVLLARLGRAPSERFALFASFYDIIYAREVEKNTPAAIALDKHRNHVTTLHANIGLLLQQRSAGAGSTESIISRDEVRNVLAGMLNDDGWKDAELKDLVDQLMSAATERLVFLVALRDDQIGFELRSLQEYCASIAVLNGSDEEIQRNLTEISCSDYWRNTMLFACGQIFSTTTARRDTVISLCHNLNDGLAENFPGTNGSLMGSRLALDLLADGVTATAPRYQGALTKIAIELLEPPFDPAIPKLASITGLNHDSKRILDDAVAASLGGSYPDHRIGGLRFLSAQACQGGKEALRLLQGICLSADTDTRISYLVGALRTADSILTALTAQELLDVGPARARQIIGNLGEIDTVEQVFETVTQGDLPIRPSWLHPLLVSARHEDLAYGCIGRPPLNGFIVALSPMKSAFEPSVQPVSSWLRLATEQMTSEWSFITQAAGFARRPGIDTWESAVAALRTASSKDVDAWIDTLPWPLALWWMGGHGFANDTNDSKAAEYQQEIIGTWYSAQASWRKSTPQRLSIEPKLTPKPAGLPLVCASPARHPFEGRDNTDYRKLAISILASSNRYHRRAASTWILRRISGYYGSFFTPRMASKLGPDIIVQLAQAAESVPLGWIAKIIDDQAWNSAFNSIGMLEGLEIISAQDEEFEADAATLVTRWLKHPEYVGLARLAAHLPLGSIPPDLNEVLGLGESARTYAAILAAWSGAFSYLQVNEIADMILSEQAATILPFRHWTSLPISRLTAPLLATVSIKLRKIDPETSWKTSRRLEAYYSAERRPDLDQVIEAFYSASAQIPDA